MPLTHIEQHYFFNPTVTFIMKTVFGDTVNYTNIANASRTLDKTFSPPRTKKCWILSLVLMLTGCLDHRADHVPSSCQLLGRRVKCQVLS